MLSGSRHKTVFASFGDGAKAFAALISRGENDERVGVRGGEGVDGAVLTEIQLEKSKEMKQWGQQEWQMDVLLENPKNYCIAGGLWFAINSHSCW